MPAVRLLVAGAALAAGGLMELDRSAGRSGPPAVVVSDAAGEEIARETLPEDRSFALAYRHSYYRAPAREVFRADGRGFSLRAVASPRAAVLDYYGLAGRRTRGSGWLRLEPRERQRYRRLSLIATVTGRRTLVVGERRVQLFEGGRARHVTLSVEGGS